MARDLLTKFFRFCADNDLDLLKDDIRFICARLSKIPPERHREAMRGYLGEWQQGVAEAPNVVQAQNMGRRRANLYLLDFGSGRG